MPNRRMHAGLLDVLHDASDDDILAIGVVVGKRINIDLDRIIQKTIEQHR